MDYNYYQIKVKPEQENFDAIYKYLKSIGIYSIYYGEIILKTDCKLNNIEKNLLKLFDKAEYFFIVCINENQTLKNPLADNWVKQEQFADRTLKAQEEIENRMQRFYSILEDANKMADKMKEKENKTKGGEKMNE